MAKCSWVYFVEWHLCLWNDFPWNDWDPNYISFGKIKKLNIYILVLPFSQERAKLYCYNWWVAFFVTLKLILYEIILKFEPIQLTYIIGVHTLVGKSLRVYDIINKTTTNFQLTKFRNEENVTRGRQCLMGQKQFNNLNLPIYFWLFLINMIN